MRRLRAENHFSEGGRQERKIWEEKRRKINGEEERGAKLGTITENEWEKKGDNDSGREEEKNRARGRIGGERWRWGGSRGGKRKKRGGSGTIRVGSKGGRRGPRRSLVVTHHHFLL